ncbi:MAG: tRNA (adenosine(37)-N6)-threonylcarbamoyltransferase complex ATPase subunit type 1 TsaE [Hyphomonadaceae bacterium]
MNAAAALDSRVLSLPDAAATEALGARLAALLRPGDVVCLKGELGAGKTTLARGAISVWAGAGEVPSPTYTLLQIYEGAKGPLWHVDLYRLRRPEEVWELGLEEGFVEAACLIEWPERLGASLPRDRLEVVLEAAGDGRRAVLTGYGAWSSRLDEI